MVRSRRLNSAAGIFGMVCSPDSLSHSRIPASGHFAFDWPVDDIACPDEVAQIGKSDPGIARIVQTGKADRAWHDIFVQEFHKAAHDSQGGRAVIEGFL